MKNSSKIPATKVFSDQEKKQIISEFEHYTIKKEREPNLNENSQYIPTDPFGEQMLASTLNEDLKNVSTRSIILAPFNSTRSNLDDISFDH